MGFLRVGSPGQTANKPGLVLLPEMGTASLLGAHTRPQMRAPWRAHLPPPAKATPFGKVGGFRVRGPPFIALLKPPPSPRDPHWLHSSPNLEEGPLLCLQQRKQRFFTPDKPTRTLAVMGTMSENGTPAHTAQSPVANSCFHARPILSLPEQGPSQLCIPLPPSCSQEVLLTVLLPPGPRCPSSALHLGVRSTTTCLPGDTVAWASSWAQLSLGCQTHPHPHHVWLQASSEPPANLMVPIFPLITQDAGTLGRSNCCTQMLGP